MLLDQSVALSQRDPTAQMGVCRRMERAQSRMLPGTQQPHQGLLWPIRVTFNKSLLWTKYYSKSFTHINVLNSHNNHMLDGLIISPKVCDPYTGFMQSLDIY